MSNLKRWSLADAEELYNVQGWGLGYFGINAQGHMAAYPARDAGPSPRDAGGIDIKALIDDALARGHSTPLLVRFSGILAHRLADFHGAFAKAIAAHSYQGGFQGAYPLKVNQQRHVVEEVVRFGAEHRMGLEVGSKPELYAALATLETPDGVIVCNGYKDEDYVRMALLAQKLGRRVYLVAEKLDEVGMILRVAGDSGLKPLLGIRVRPVKTGSGRWEDSGGDASKFGLASWELVEAVRWLREAGELDAFRLLHAHLGSQITNIRRVKEAVQEVARYFVELRRMGCLLDHVDIGGGLGIDYDGTRSTHGFSTNYTLAEYAHDVVGMMAEVCNDAGQPHPVIVCESGRALTAHHSMLVLDVLHAVGLAAPLWEPSPLEDAPELAAKMAALLAGLTPRTLSGHWAEAQHLRDEAGKRFELGYLPLAQRARIDQTFWAIARRVERLKGRLKRVPEELEALEPLLADKYFCNFSVFQSLPDAWAMHQEFPVAPLHRLEEKPGRAATLQDITCDSDGRLVNYIGGAEQAESIPLHKLRPGEPYYLGVFLIGAYQEILGDLHNLFGDTDAIHVTLDGDGGWRYEQVIGGESVADVLEYVQFDRERLRERIARQVSAAVAAGGMSAREGQAFRDRYAAGLAGPTYLRNGSAPQPAASRPGGRQRAG